MGTPSEYSYFTNYTNSKAALYLLSALFVLCCCVVSLAEPFLLKYSDEPCRIEHDRSEGFENINYDTNPCMETRLPVLMYLTPKECSFGRRIVIATILGGLIGWERRQADRPAGIRTMSLVSLGSCLFSICSAFAFFDGPETYDGSRVAAAIPSGVGFLGAGLIYKESQNHQVHGLTTAASLWLSAAVGIACAGELYFSASFSVALVLILLRFGPRTLDLDEHGDDNSARIDAIVVNEYGSIGPERNIKDSDENQPSRPDYTTPGEIDPELQLPLSRRSSLQASRKSLPSLIA